MKLVYANFVTRPGEGGEYPSGPFPPYNWSLGLLYPDEPTMRFHPTEVREYAAHNPVDIMLLEGPTEVASVSACFTDLAHWCKTQGIMTACHDGDYFRSWSSGSSDAFKSAIATFGASDVVMVRNKSHCDFVQRLTSSPVVHWADYVTSATAMEDGFPVHDRKLIAIPHGPLEQRSHMRGRGDIATVAILRALYTAFPDYTYCIMNGIQDHPVCMMYGLPVHRAPTLPREQNDFPVLLDALSQCRMLLDMDDAAIGGGWIVDACSVGTPVVCTHFTSAGYAYSEGGRCTTHALDVATAIQYATRLIVDDDFWRGESEHATHVAKGYTAAAARRTLEDAYAANERRQVRRCSRLRKT